MKKQLISKTKALRGGYGFKDPVTGLVWDRAKYPTWGQFRNAVFNSHIANEKVLGLDWDGWLEEEYCKQNEHHCQEPMPSLGKQLMTFSTAMMHWAKDGFKTVSEEQLQQRRDICGECKYFRGEAMLGLGRCRKCGCSSLKLYLRKTKCPDNRWGVITD